MRRRNAAAAVQLVEDRISAALPAGADSQLVAKLKAVIDALTAARHD